MKKLSISTILSVGIIFMSNLAHAEPNVSCPTGYYPVCDDEVGCWCKKSSSGGSGHRDWIIIESMSSPIFRSTTEAETFDVLIADLTDEELNELLLVLELQSVKFSR